MAPEPRFQSKSQARNQNLTSARTLVTKTAARVPKTAQQTRPIRRAILYINSVRSKIRRRPKSQSMSEKPSTTLPGTVEKIIKSPYPSEPEKAQIAIEGADHLYKEIRIENTLKDETGNEVRLKQ